MKIGLHISDFTFSKGPSGLAEDLTRVVAGAEDAGFARVSVMDHVWQISVHGPPEHEMLEAYTTLGYLAARTSRVDLLAWVTAVTYRPPGLLAKIVSTLDVLSGGRACTTVAVFRCVAALSLSVIRGRQDVVTLRYGLSRWGGYPGPVPAMSRAL